MCRHVCAYVQWRRGGGGGGGRAHPSEYIGISQKNQVLSDFSHVCKGRKYLIFNGTTKSLHCKKHLFMNHKSATMITVCRTGCCCDDTLKRRVGVSVEITCGYVSIIEAVEFEVKLTRFY